MLVPPEKPYNCYCSGKIYVGYLSDSQIHADLHITFNSVSLDYLGEIQYNIHKDECKIPVNI